jgi:hypothetical protein
MLKIIGGQLIQDVMQPGFVGRQQEKLAPEAFRQFRKVLIFRLWKSVRIFNSTCRNAGNHTLNRVS